MDNYKKFLEIYDGKRFVSVVVLNNCSENQIAALKLSFDIIIENCNRVQSEVVFGSYYLDETLDGGLQTFGVIVSDDYEYSDETIRSYINTQAYTIVGLLYERLLENMQGIF